MHTLVQVESLGVRVYLTEHDKSQRLNDFDISNNHSINSSYTGPHTSLSLSLATQLGHKDENLTRSYNIPKDLDFSN